MNWRNVRLIWFREMRDQLRDQRTLFMVAVLPVLMYPLLGTTFLQLSQFMRQHTAKVLVVGAEQLEGVDALPPLIDGERFAADLFDTKEQTARIEIEEIDATAAVSLADGGARDRLAKGEVDVLLFFPDGFAERLNDLRERLEVSRAAGEPLVGIEAVVPQPLVLSNGGREPSQVARLRVDRLLARWQQRLVQGNLQAISAPSSATRPFVVEYEDVATPQSRDALLWSKLLPFVVFVWALTGAFYPAIDLCAGEKERGTLETLLASPAKRSEIVGGKLLTVMTFSIFTACLNLLSLSLTAHMVIGQLASLAPGAGLSVAPPALSAILWLLVALVPIATLFSALSLACASFARSTKEGQYYFMPLFLGAMPLMLLPMSPGLELNLGNSLVPVMGLVLLLRGVIEGRVVEVLPFVLPALAVTGVCCWMALKWAVSQFNQESVLFREGERLSLRGWMASLVRRREATPTPSAAIACIVGIFIAQFVLRQALMAWPPAELSPGYFVNTVPLSQLVILVQALLVTRFLALDWRKTLLLERPGRQGSVVAMGAAMGPVAMGAALAVALHPVKDRLSGWILELYPLSEELKNELTASGELMGMAPSIGVTLLLLALLPAICEEIAFRGVLLGGLRKNLGSGGAILFTAVVFGATHTILQQSLAAVPMGIILGILAVKTGSLLACITFHAVSNGLALLMAEFGEKIRAAAADFGVSSLVFQENEGEQVGYSLIIAILGGVAALVMIRALGRKHCGSPQSPTHFSTAS